MKHKDEKIGVFTAGELEDLGAQKLPPLKVSSLDEIIESLPRYYYLFKHLYTKADGPWPPDIKPIRYRAIEKDTSKYGTSYTSRGVISNVVRFGGTCIGGHFHFFDNQGWLIQKIAGVSCLDDISAQKIIETLTNKEPYHIWLAQFGESYCRFLSEKRGCSSQETLKEMLENFHRALVESRQLPQPLKGEFDKYLKGLEKADPNWALTFSEKRRFHSLAQLVEYIRLAVTLEVPSDASVKLTGDEIAIYRRQVRLHKRF